MTVSYAYEKMTQVVGSLAVGVEPLPERLTLSVQPHLFSAAHDATGGGYLPPGLLQRLQAVCERITSAPNQGEGTTAASIAKMTAGEGQEIAFEIVAMSDEVTALYHQHLEDEARRLASRSGASDATEAERAAKLRATQIAYHKDRGL
jgi:hypothetical protein